MDNTIMMTPVFLSFQHVLYFLHNLRNRQGTEAQRAFTICGYNGFIAAGHKTTAAMDIIRMIYGMLISKAIFHRIGEKVAQVAVLAHADRLLAQNGRRVAKPGIQSKKHTGLMNELDRLRQGRLTA